MADAMARLLESMMRRQAEMPARLSARTEDVFASLEILKGSLDSALHGLEGRAGIRDLRIGEGLEPERIRGLVLGGRLEELSQREARYVMLSFLEFPGGTLARLLESRPPLWRTFARQVLLRWEVSLERTDWEDYSKLLAQIPSSLSPIEAPMALWLLAGREGAGIAASRVAGRTVGEVHRTIVEEWRLQPSWSLTPHILVGWMRRSAGRRQGLLESVRELIAPEGASLRALVLPLPGNQSAGRGTGPNLATKGPLPLGSALAHVRGVAALLEARFSGSGALDEPTFGALEPVLLRSTFGDPRAVSVSEGWKEVRKLAEQPFDVFFQSLVREDLALFFRHLMRAGDRERFWLRYLGSIRRTLCVLDPEGYGLLDRKLTGAPESTRAALGRVVRTRGGHIDKTCAFCLFFEDYVMVEFSVVGNAGYLYERHTFEQIFLPRISQGSLDSPAALKDQRRSKHRLIHGRRWQQSMREELLRLPIEPDRPAAGRLDP